MHTKRCFCIFFHCENTVISHNFLVWKFYGKAQFPHSFHTRKLGEITVFYAVFFVISLKKVWKLGYLVFCVRISFANSSQLKILWELIFISSKYPVFFSTFQNVSFYYQDIKLTLKKT